MSSKKFKNSFGVTGSEILLGAFIKDAKLMGWEEQVHKTDDKTRRCLYFANNAATNSLKANHFWWCHSIGTGNIAYILPQDYDIALKAASEIIEEDKVEELKVGDWVKVVDSPGFKERWRAVNGQRAIGHIFKLEPINIAELTTSSNKETAERVNTYQVNYKRENLQKLTGEELLQWLVKRSGLKVGDKGKFAGKRYSSSEFKREKVGQFAASFSDSNVYTLVRFELFNDIPCCVVNDNYGGGDYYIPLEQFEDSDIEIGGYTAKVESGKIAFGCQSITPADLLTIKKLLNGEINAKITIHGTEITRDMIDKLISKLQK